MPIKSSEKSRLAELREEMGHVNASPTARRAVPGRKVKTMHHSPEEEGACCCLLPPESASSPLSNESRGGRKTLFRVEVLPGPVSQLSGQSYSYGWRR